MRKRERLTDREIEGKDKEIERYSEKGKYIEREKAKERKRGEERSI